MLVTWPFIFWIVLPKWSIVPSSVGLGLSLFVFVFFIWLSISFFSLFLFYYYFAHFFFFWILWIFLHAPKLCLGTFKCWGFFFVSRTCPPVWGVILVEVIFKKHYQAQKETAKDIFQSCEKIIKDDLSSSQMHAFRIGKPCFHANMQSDFSLFIQIKLSFRVTSWCFCFCFSSFL